MLFAPQLILEYMNEMTVGGKDYLRLVGLSATRWPIGVEEEEEGSERRGLAVLRLISRCLKGPQEMGATQVESFPLIAYFLRLSSTSPSISICTCFNELCVFVWEKHLEFGCSCVHVYRVLEKRQEDGSRAWYQVPPEDGEEDSIRRTAECTVTEKILGHNHWHCLWYLISNQFNFNTDDSQDRLRMVGQPPLRWPVWVKKEEENAERGGRFAIISC